MSTRILDHMTYPEYLETPAWKRIRWAVLWLHEERCAICGDLATEVHHRDYTRIGEERPEDLTPLCAKCHQLVEEELMVRQGAVS